MPRIGDQDPTVEQDLGRGQGRRESFASDISADGRFAAFESDAANLPGGDGANFLIYRRGPL